MGTAEFTEIANIIADRLLHPEDDAMGRDCRQRVTQLCDRFPLYPPSPTPGPGVDLTSCSVSRPQPLKLSTLFR